MGPSARTVFFFAPDLTVKSSYGIVLNYRKLNRDNYAYVERNGSKVQKNKLTLFFFLFYDSASICVISLSFKKHSSKIRLRGEGFNV